MPRNFQNINDYVLQLLNNEQEIKPESQALTYAYPGERNIYQDPCIPGKRVVMVKSQYDAAGLITGHPDLSEEAYSYINNLSSAACYAIEQDPLIRNKEQTKEALLIMVERFKNSITADHGGIKADLFSSMNTAQNKAFLKHLKEVKKELQLFTQVVSKISNKKLKTLEHAGYLLRSQNRDTLIHRFKVQAPEAKEEVEQFIMYIPCGRYTKRQQELMRKNEVEEKFNNAERDHDTSSHNRKDLVLGNSNMVRVIAGTQHENGAISIHHDSFSGPGARMPYSDFKNADAYKKLALKAITLINQEEIIQTLAQREIDRMTDEELIAHIEKQDPLDGRETRAQLISLYLKKHTLSVTECYTQVVSAGQKISAENQKEQFEFVRQMMDVFNDSQIPISIQTDRGSEEEARVTYQARISSWGVNWFRHAGTSWNPLIDNRITQKQNARFINQMTDDLLTNLDSDTNTHLCRTYEELQSLKERLAFAYILPPKIQHFTNLIAQEEGQIKQYKQDYRDLLFAYFEEYNQEENLRDPIRLEAMKREIETLEAFIHTNEERIYSYHQQIENERKRFFYNHKEEINASLQQVRIKIEQEIVNVDSSTKEKLQHFYNSCAYFTRAQALYYEDTWHHQENTFKLQTLTASLALELDYANTKGCKSNNDRGQRLTQKIVGNALWTATNHHGLYTGEFLEHRHDHKQNNDQLINPVSQFDRELTTIQALHHTANTGVSGGKYEILDPSHFADNGLWGEIASLAKIKNMEASSTKNLKWKMLLGLSLAGIIGTIIMLFPPLNFLGIVAMSLTTASLAATVFHSINHTKKINLLVNDALEEAAGNAPRAFRLLNGLESLEIDPLNCPSQEPLHIVPRRRASLNDEDDSRPEFKYSV